jgi:hypothetical protein
LAELDETIAGCWALNHRPFRKREATRRILFETLDQPALRPLPAERYQYGEWRTARVNIDYHIEFERHYYSVPYQLTGQEVELRASPTTLEVFHRGVRVASHIRNSVPHDATTVTEHRPKSHQKHLGGPPRGWSSGPPAWGRPPPVCASESWTASRIPRWAFDPAWASSAWPSYSTERMEAAARRAGSERLLLSESQVHPRTRLGRCRWNLRRPAGPRWNTTTSAERISFDNPNLS